MTLLALPPIRTSLNGVTEEATVHKAINQLVSIIAGREIARITNELIDDPHLRVLRACELAANELVTAQRESVTDPCAIRAVQQSQRKIQSLNSLLVLTRVLTKEIELDDEVTHETA